LVIWEQEEQKNENRAWDSSKNSRIRLLIMNSKTWAVTFSTRHRLQRRYQEAIPFDVRYCIHVRYCIFFYFGTVFITLLSMSRFRITVLRHGCDPLKKVANT
jgi:hypothetical protein